ncbi:MAG: hypothetical protein D6693_05435 [Planctomycetota bacterium]|nr:MAG: hypothetical protein D6693_05435 [Planctomycetota bacterium]
MRSLDWSVFPTHRFADRAAAPGGPDGGRPLRPRQCPLTGPGRPQRRRRPDVVTVQFTDPAFVPQVGRAFGDGAGGFTDNALFDARRPFALAVGDLNNDGLDDLVISHGGPISPVIDQDTDLSVMLNTSTVDPATGEIVISFMHTGVLGEGGSIQPFRFTAIDQFGNLSARDEPRVYPHSVELADLDGDGDLDIITTRSRKTHETTTGTPNGANPEGGETLGVIPGDPNDDNFDFINAATGVANNDYIAIFENLSIVCNGADLNGDGIVNGGDLSVILNLFGCAGGGAFTGDAGGSTPSAQPQPLMVAGPGSLYGFSSMDSYIQWLNALTPEEQIEHCLDLIDRLQRPQR